MDPVTGSALISAGGSLLGGLLGNSSAKKAAQAQMAFQERMDNTKYQRATVDMRAAGINPMLAINNGVGGAPSGALAKTTDPITPAIEAGNSARKSAAEVENLRTQNDAIQSSTDLNRTLATKALADTDLATSAAAQAKANTAITTLQTEEQSNKNKKAAATSPAYDALKNISNYLVNATGNAPTNAKKILNYLNPVDAISDLFRSKPTSAKQLQREKPLAIPNFKLNKR